MLERVDFWFMANHLCHGSPLRFSVYIGHNEFQVLYQYANLLLIKQIRRTPSDAKVRDDPDCK